MGAFEDREKGFEAKYKLDQELAFKAHSRRDKLFGLWVAERLGVTGPAAQTYAMAMVAEDFRKPGDDDVIDKAMTDLKAAGKAVTEAEIRTALTQLEAEAVQQVQNEA